MSPSGTASNTPENRSSKSSSSGDPPPPPPLAPPPAHLPGVPPPPSSIPPNLPAQRSLEQPPTPFQPTWYFFYGSLTNPSWLKEVLSLPSDPTLHPAITVGYEVLQWGHHKVLVDGEPGKVVHGFAFLVERKEDADQLAFYETDNYEVGECEIKFTDKQGGEPTGETVMGAVFMWRGDKDKLKRGEFDRGRCLEKLRRRGLS
ncbi:hypothetical protein VTJ49DRAFT_6633 [Mycothermus thermophilus]|uniref:Putative gamma-glutamylcyclotransferase n=1 Tax=Humicola insolens TaxID=85995 RepID=A0ABR3V125_HUMIN